MKTLTKLTIILGAILATTLLLSSNTVENSPRCEKKIDNIQEQIQIAKSLNNTERVNGLVISLTKVKAYCSDEGLVEDIEDKLSDTQEDLQEHVEDYREAIKNNRTDKIQKYKVKIDEDNAKIKRLEMELNS